MALRAPAKAAAPLLSWNGSALVLDVKGELDYGDPHHGFPGTSGYRAQMGSVLRFAPTDPTSNAFNVLFSVRRGVNEVRDVRNIVPNHLGGLAGAVGLAAIISVIANQSQDDHQTDGSLAQSVGDAAAQQAAQTGSQIVQRELTVHPTLRIRPGANVRVLVTRDIALRLTRSSRPTLEPAHTIRTKKEH